MGATHLSRCQRYKVMIRTPDGDVRFDGRPTFSDTPMFFHVNKPNRLVACLILNDKSDCVFKQVSQAQ